MIAYATGDPIEALELLAPWVTGVHCKDAVSPRGEGQLGEERPGKSTVPGNALGLQTLSGDQPIQNFFEQLLLCICERFHA
jgi:hypothetical protein